MTNLEMLDGLMWGYQRPNPPMTEGDISSAWRGMYFEYPGREAVQQALREHPAVVTEGLTYRLDKDKRADWLVDQFKFSEL